jgi:hypothetical protein
LAVPDAYGFRLVGHFCALEGGAWIFEAQATGGFFTGAVGYVFIAFLEVRRTPFQVVGVGGQEVDPVAV